MPKLSGEELEQLEQQAELGVVAQYVGAGEPDGCYWCGGEHPTNCCRQVPNLEA